MALFLITTACANDTSPRLDEAHSGSFTEESPDGEEIQKMSMDDLAHHKQQDMKEIMSYDYKNLHFVNNFSFDVPEEIGKYQIVCMDNFQDKWDVLSSRYIPEEIYDENKVTIDERYLPVGPDFYDEKSGAELGTGNIGFFRYVQKKSEMIDSIIFNEESFHFRDIKSYLLSSDYSDDVYKLKGENVLISEAAETAFEFASEFTKVSEYPQKLMPSVATVYQDESENTVMEVRFSSSYMGLPICATPSRLKDTGFDMYSFSSAVSYLEEKGKINSFTVQYAFEDHETVETYDGIVTPKCAVRLLDNMLSEYAEYDVLGMELVYCPVMMGKDDLNANQAEDALLEAENAMYAGRILELTPYWAIYIDVTWGKEIYGLVDCVTGELEFVNNQR